MKICKSWQLNSLSLKINSAAIHERPQTPKKLPQRSKSVVREVKETGTSVSPRSFEDETQSSSFDLVNQDVLKVLNNDDSILEMPSYLEESPRKQKENTVLKVRNISQNLKKLPKKLAIPSKKSTNRSGSKSCLKKSSSRKTKKPSKSFK